MGLLQQTEYISCHHLQIVSNIHLINVKIFSESRNCSVTNQKTFGVPQECYRFVYL